MGDKPICIRCLEDFPVAQEPTHWTMGYLRPVKKLPAKVRGRLRVDPDDIRGEPHLCGNCYFDLTDED